MEESAQDTGKPAKRRVGRPKGSKNGPNAGKNGNPVGRPRKNPPKAAESGASQSASKNNANTTKTKTADTQEAESGPKAKKKESPDITATRNSSTPEAGDHETAASGGRSRQQSVSGVSRTASASASSMSREASANPSLGTDTPVSGPDNVHNTENGCRSTTQQPSAPAPREGSSEVHTPARARPVDETQPVDETPTRDNRLPQDVHSHDHEREHAVDSSSSRACTPEEVVAELDAAVTRKRVLASAPGSGGGGPSNDKDDDEVVTLIPSALEEEDPASEAVPVNANAEDTSEAVDPDGDECATAQGEASQTGAPDDEEDACEDDEDDSAMQDEFRDPCDDEEAEEGTGEPAGSSAGPSNAPAPDERPAGMKSFFRQQQSGRHEPRSTIPTWLEEDYKETCARLKDEMKRGYKKRPVCYQAGTFWDTGKNPFFASLTQFQLNPRLFCRPRYFVWFPHLFQRIPCPACLSVNRRMKKKCELPCLTPHTLPKRPRRVYDIADDHTYIIGQRYRCGHPDCRKTYQSWSPAVLNMLPPSLAAQFTFQLTHRSGLTDDLATLLRSCFQRGMGPSPFADMIRTFHIRRYEQLHLQYLEMVHSRALAVESNLIGRHESFGDWVDPATFGGSVPSANYFRMFYIHALEKQSGVLDQSMAMLSARYLCIDHSFKVIKHLGKVNGAQIFGALLSAVNEYGECRAMALTMTKAHDQSMPALSQIPNSTQKYGHDDTEIIFTDSPRADKGELERIFPALLRDVEPVLSSSLEQLRIPVDCDVYVLGSTWLINSRIQALLDDVRDLPSNSRFALAMDMEWPVDRANGIEGRVAVITIAFDRRVYVIPVSPYIRDGFLSLPTVLLGLMRNERIIKYGVHIKGDFTRLFRDCGLVGKTDEHPFVGATELGAIAHNHHLAERANVSLIDLTARILRRSLLKETSIRISTRWDELPLSKDQIDYAALDAYASWKLYEALHARTGVPSGMFVSLSTPVGTHVKLLSRDHTSVVAYGVLSADRPPKFDGVNVTPTRALVNVTAVLMPAYLMRRELLKSKQATPLSELIASGLPCAVLCCLKDLQTCIGEEAKTVPRPQAQSGQLPSCPLIQPAEPYSDPTLSEPEPGVSSLAPGDDKKADYDAEQEQKLEDSMADPRSAERAQMLSGLLNMPEGAYRSSPVRSRVIGDLWHFMDQFKVPIHHGLRRPFVRALRDALLIPDPADRDAVMAVVSKETKSTFDQLVLHHSDWVWQRVRRHVPPPEELAPCVLAVLQTYGPMKDAVTGQPLFNDAAFEAIPPALENLQKGYYSDPPDIPMYMTRGKDANGLTLYRCVRGTNNVEGGIHQNLAKRIGSYNASPRFARNLLRDYCYHHNARVGTLNRTGVPYKHSFDIWTLNHISELQDQTSHLFVNHAKQPLRGWVNGNHYEPSTEHFSILPLLETVRHKLGMLEYNAVHTSEIGIKHADLAAQQGTRFAVLPVHTPEERAFYRILVQNNSGHFAQKTTPNWVAVAQEWSAHCDGKSIFYKLPEHLKNYYKKWSEFRNEKNSTEQNLAAYNCIRNMLASHATSIPAITT